MLYDIIVLQKGNPLGGKMRHLFKKKRLLALFVAPILAATPLLAEETKEAPKQEVVVNKENSKQVQELGQLIAKRLELSKQLAIYKWNNQIAIDEPKKEEAFLASMEEKASKKGLDPKIVRSFFQSQIEAAKDIKIQAFEKWVKEGVHKHEEVINLDETVAKIQECDDQLLNIISSNTQDLLDQKSKDKIRVMVSKVLKASKFSRDCIDSATNF